MQACAPPYLVKIGQSLHPKQRLGDMAVGCPVGLVMVWHVPALTFGEQLLHAAFSNQWVRGEWFEPHPNLVRFVKDAKAAAPKMLAPEYVETNLVPLATYTGPEFEQYVWTYRKLFEGMPGYPDAPIGKGDGDFSHRL